MTTLTEADVEQPALAWLSDLGWQVAHGPDIAPDTPGAERAGYGQVVLERLPCWGGELNAQIIHGPGKLGGPGELLYSIDSGCEDRAPVCEQSQRYAPTQDQLTYEHKVVVGGNLLAEQCDDRALCGVVDCHKQRELRSPVFEPPVMSAFYLHQHTLLRHPLTTYPVLGWTATSGTK